MESAKERQASTIVFLCFFLSGMAGLAYEVLWIRQLSLVFGTTSFAVSTVLAAFMGGLALGSWLFGRIADRRGDTLRLYAWLELGIGVYCLLIPLLFQGVTTVYTLTARSVGGSFYMMSLVRFLLCATVLVLPTTFMGATLPLLSRYVVRRMDRLGSGVGRLYGVNTFGAVAGTFLTGYLLIGTIGVFATTVAAAAVNGVVALLAFSLWRSEGPREPSPAEETSVEGGKLPVLHGAILAGIALSGFASLTYEVAWTRLLSLVLGSSVYAFTAMLTTFLLGIAIGSMIISKLADRLDRPFAAFAVVQVCVAFGVLGVTPLLDRLPMLFLILFGKMGGSFWVFQIAEFLLCVVVMFLPTLFIGATLPLAAKAFTSRLDRVARSVGTVYASNTVGAIAGSFLAGFVFLPLVGTQKTILAASAVNITVAVMILMLLPRPGRPLRLGLSAAAVLVFAAASSLGGNWDRYMLNSGLFDSPRYSLHQVGQKGFQEFVRSYDIRYYEEGTYANVAVSFEAENLFLQINGRTEASTASDMSNQILVSQIPMLVHPNPKKVLVIGLGSGITLGSVLTHPVDRADCVEISPAVVRAADYFRDWHDDVLRDPLANVILDDGRNRLLASEETYDVVISEPSKPWISGVSNLFTRESYELYKKRLKKGGVACQWFHYYSMSPRDFKITVRTFLSVFPYVQVWNVDNNVFLLGSEDPLMIDTSVMAERMRMPKVAADLERVNVGTPYLLLGYFLFGEEEAREYVGEGPINTDNLPIIEFSAPRHRDSYLQSEILESMLDAFPRYNRYPLTGHIRQEGNTIDYALAGLRFTSPVSWQSGVANMNRTVLPEERLEGAEGPLLAYRLEARMIGAAGDELGMVAISRGDFAEEKLLLTLERLFSGQTEKGRTTISGEPAFWSTYEDGGRSLAAITWYYPPNSFQYLVQFVGAPGRPSDEIRRMLLEGASCVPLSGTLPNGRGNPGGEELR
ncbi:MAG: fused MFS/spermidine synthase [Candidatus Eisenbacteria bacterium]